MKILIALPNFKGFYDTILDPNEIIYRDEDTEDYQPINYRESCTLLGKEYTNLWWRKYGEILREYGINKVEFDKVDFPKEYNFKSEDIEAYLTINKRVFLRKMRNIIKQWRQTFESIIKHRHKSRDGFASFYSHHIEDWINKYLTAEINNVIVETCIVVILYLESDNFNFNHTDEEIENDLTEKINQDSDKFIVYE